MVVAATAEVIAFNTLPEDGVACRRAEMLIAKAGEVALSNVVSFEYAGLSKPQNLLEATELARQGDERGLNMIRVNAHTDVLERTIKAGMVLTVGLEQDEQGRICQNGQTNETIQFNTALHLGRSKVMQPRFQGETNNSFRLQMAKETGRLEEYNFVVISRYPDATEMSDSVAMQNGFFGDTKSLSVQSTSMSGDLLETESAFVAGVPERGAERHDAEMVGKFGDIFGVNLWKSAAETIDTPMLVPKSLMPNGVVDVVRMLDDINGNTFFGQDKPQEDYVVFKEKCREREQEMSPIVDKIVSGMLANAHKLNSPTDATKMLDQLSALYTLEHAVVDERIDARVFGEAAAWRIEDARAHFILGDIERARIATTRAYKVQKSSSCPTGNTNPSDSPDKFMEGLEGDTEKEQDEKVEDCDFISKECPKCGAKNVKTECRNGKYYGACGCTS